MSDFYNDLMDVEKGLGREELVELERVQDSVFPSLGSSCLRISSSGVGSVPMHTPTMPLGREVPCGLSCRPGSLWPSCCECVGGRTPLTRAQDGLPSSVGGPFSLKEGSLALTALFCLHSCPVCVFLAFKGSSCPNPFCGRLSAGESELVHALHTGIGLLDSLTPREREN